MSETLSYAGIEPVIQLLVASLKAAKETIDDGELTFAQKII